MHKVTVVTQDGAPQGRRLFVIWDVSTRKKSLSTFEPVPIPSAPVQGAVNYVAATTGCSSLTSAIHIAAAIIQHGARMILFCRTRKMTELAVRFLRRHLRHHAPEFAACVQAYRGGYAAEDRRTIERGLADGVLRCVIATR